MRHVLKRIRITFVALPLAIAVMGNPRAAPADDLLQLREDVRAPSAGPPAEKKKSRRDHDHWDEEDEHWNDLLEALCYPVVIAASSPFWGPAAMVGDDYSRVGHFAIHPYHQSDRGYMVLEDDLWTDPYPWTARLRFEYGDDFQGLSRIGGHLLWDSQHRIGIDTAFDYRHEDLSAGLADELWTGDANVVFRFAQSERLQMRTGIGLNWLADSAATDLGFNFTYGGDWFPAKPWVVSAELDVGRLGSATLFHGRATAGVQLRSVELFVGYDYFDVGNTQIDGLISGIRYWY